MGDPGAGAEDQASRRARKIERLREQAARGGEVDQAMLQRALADQRAWSVGAEGERQVADVLAMMQRYGWTALRDVHWPGRPQANIDHIAIGPGGVVVVDAKNWSGTVTVRDGVLRQNGYQREREMEGVAQATAAVTALLAPEHRMATRGVLCLASQEQDLQATASTGVAIVGRWQLPELLLNLPARLTVYEAADIARLLSQQLDRQTLTSRRPRPPRTAPARRPRRAAGTAPRRRSGCLAALGRLGATIVALLLGYLFLVHVLLPMLSGVSQ